MKDDAAFHKYLERWIDMQTSLASWYEASESYISQLALAERELERGPHAGMKGSWLC